MKVTVTEKRFFDWHEDDVSVTLRNKGGSYGGGSEVLVIYDESDGAGFIQHKRNRGCCENDDIREK